MTELVFKFTKFLICKGFRAISWCKPNKVSFSNIFTLRMVSCIVWYENVVLILSLVPLGGAIEVWIYRSVGSLMHQRLMQDVTIPKIDKTFSSFSMNQDIVVATTKAEISIMNPHSLQISPRNMWQATNCIAVEDSILFGLLFLKVITIHLYLYNFCFVSKLGIKAPSVSHFPSRITVIPHCSHTCSFGNDTSTENTRVFICYPVWM